MIFTALVFLSIIVPKTALAYIDPGTGGMIGSSLPIIGIVLTSVFSFVLAYFLKPLWRLIKKISVKLWLYKKTTIAVIILLAGAFLVFNGYFAKILMINSHSDTNKKVIVLGIDGFDPDVMDFLMGQGKLPNFEKLAEAGTFDRLKTTEPPISPVVWTTISTGVNPGRHNIFDFMWFDRQKYLPYLSVLDQDNSFFGMKFIQPVKVPSFWQNISQNGIPVSVIHWPVTFPPQDINGNNLSGLGTPDIRGYLNGYVRYTNKSVDGNSYGTDRVVSVSVSGNQVQADFNGPFKSNGEIVTEPFVITIIDNNNATLSVQGNVVNIKRGEWSDWISVKFKKGFGQNTETIFKIFAQEFSPQFDVFATSMQFDPKAPAVKISSPDNYSSYLADEIGDFYTLGMPEDAKAVNDLNLSQEAFLKQVDEIRVEREKMFWTEYKKLLENNKGVLALVFDETDRAEHILFGKEVEYENGKIKSIGPDLEKIYTDKDKLIGQILKTLPGDASLMVVSDHGFKPFKRAVNLNNWLLDNGYLVLKEGVSVNNAQPLFKDVDWSKTRAYSYGYVSVNINLQGREGKGIVSPDQKNKLEDEIIAKLKNFKDPENGQNIVADVYKKEQIYSGSNMDNSGDLIVGFNVPYRIDWESPVGGFSESAVFENNRPWQADHIFNSDLVPGIFFSNFKISKKPDVLDIAPTVLDLMGVSKPADYEGQTLLK